MSQPGGGGARGGLAAALCYFCWGVVVLYWRELATVNAVELIAHRIVGSLLLLVGLMMVRGELDELRTALASRAAVIANATTSVLITANWLVYVWAVTHGYVIEASLGYFMVPLISVALGRLVLHERLRPMQWAAICCAGAGVGFQIVQLGRIPWIALCLAATFGLYGLLRKRSPLGSLTGLAVETALMAPLAFAYLVWRHFSGQGALGRAEPSIQALILCAGVVTSVPLLLFAYGAKRIRLSTLGLLQYISPTVQFAIGIWVYHEAFSRERAWTFAFIWAGLAIYTVDNLWAQQKPRATPAVA